VRWLIKKLLRTTLWALLIFFCAYNIAYLKLNDFALGSYISKRVNKVERGNFQLAYVHYDYWSGMASLLFNTPAHVTAKNFELRDPDGNMVIAAEGAEVDAYLRELVSSLAQYLGTFLEGAPKFHLNLHFAHARVPTAYAVIAPLRSSLDKPKQEINLIAAMSPRVIAPAPGGGEFRITVEDVALEHADFGIGFLSPAGKLSWSGKVVDGKATAGLVYSSRAEWATTQGPFFFFKVAPLDSPTGELRLGAYTFPLEDVKAIDFGSNPEARESLAFHATARSLGAGVRVSGALTNSYSKEPGIELKLDFEHGHQLLSLLPKPLGSWLSGDPRGTLGAHGPFTHVVIDGEAENAAALVEGIEIKELATRLKLDAGLLTLEPTAKAAQGSVSGKVEVGLAAPAWWRASAHLRDVSPGALPQLSKAAQAQLDGKLDAKLKLSGSLASHTDRVDVQIVEATLERAHSNGLPRKLTLTAAGEISKAVYRIKELHADAEGLRVEASGNVDAKTQKLDGALRADSVRGARWLHTAGLPDAVKLGEAHLTGSLGGTVTRPELGGHLRAADVAVRDRKLDSAEADVQLKHGVLRVDSLSGNGLGATVEGEAAVTLLSPDGDLGKARPAPELHARLSAHGLEMAALTMWPAVQGTGEVELSVDGPLADPNGHASFRLPQMKVLGDPFEGGKIDIALGKGGARVETLHLERKAGGSLDGTGRFGWNGALDLAMSTRHFPIPGIPGVAQLPLGGTLTGDVRLTGDVSRPGLEGLAKLAGFTIRETLFGDGSVRFTPGADASAVEGKFFGGKVTVDGYFTFVPQLAFNGTLKFTNLELEKILPEMRNFAELRGVASGEARVSWSVSSGLFAALKLPSVQVVMTSEEEGRKRQSILKNDGDVLLSTDGTRLRVEQLRLVSPIPTSFSIQGTIARHDSDVRLRGTTQLELLEYFFQEAFDHTHGNAALDLSIKGDLDRPDLQGSITLADAKLEPRGMEQFIAVPSGRLDFTPQGVSLNNLQVTVEGATMNATGAVALNHWHPGTISAVVEGETSPAILKWFMKDRIYEASGRVALNVRLSGTADQPRWAGNLQVKGVKAQLRDFPQEIALREGTVRFQNFELALENLVGSLDDQPVSASGKVEFKGDRDHWLKSIDLALKGTELHQNTEQFALTFSPDVHVSGDWSRSDAAPLKLKGVVLITDGRYFAPTFEPRSLVVKPRVVERAPPIWQGVPLLETMDLDVHVLSTGQLLVRNETFNLSASTSLDISGTLSDPHFHGDIKVDSGGELTLPGARTVFTSESSYVTFDEEKRIPDETPDLNFLFNSVITDNNDLSHNVTLKITGTIVKPDVKLYATQEGWDQNDVLLLIFTGRTPNQWRQFGSSTSGGGGTPGSATDTIAKSLTGYGVGDIISDPLRRLFNLDQTTFEFSTGSVDLKLCKRFTRNFKTCGTGEVGFAGSSRVEQRLELKLSDWISGAARVEYLNQAVGTFQESNTRGKLELKLQIPLGY